MKCTLINIGQRDGKYVHRCENCETEYLSKYADPSMFKAQCRARHKPAEAPRPEHGPGRELEKLIGELNLPSLGCGACTALAKQMNLWGPDGCREHREHIVRDIRSRAAKVGWVDYFKAAAILVGQPWFSPLDPISSMVDEAIRRAWEAD